MGSFKCSLLLKLSLCISISPGNAELLGDESWDFSKVINTGFSLSLETLQEFTFICRSTKSLAPSDCACVFLFHIDLEELN